MEEILAAIPGEIISAILSGCVSWAVAVYQTRKEFEKLKMTWNRDDDVTYNEKFGAMVYATTRYAKHGSESSWKEAMSQVAEVRALADEDLGPMLDALYLVVSRKNMAGTDAALTKVISKKREIGKKNFSKTAG